MSLSDLPLSVLFMFFLWIFILIGIYPAFKRASAKMRRIRETRENQGAQTDRIPNDRTRGEVVQSTGEPLNDFDIFILRHLAQNGQKGISLKMLRSELLLDPSIVRKSVESLLDRGMVNAKLSLWRGIRFSLSPRGHDYAVAQGFIPIIQGSIDGF